MKAVVLVGGRGTRLRPLTFAVPKPLLAVGEKPILQLILERLRQAGCEEVFLATGYLAELVEAFCGDGSKFGLRIHYFREPSPLGTAGPLALLRDRFADDELFILMNGDIVTTLDLLKLMAFAREGDYDLTVACVEHTYQSPYGVLSIESGEVVGITEKPQIRSNVSAGIYVIRGSALRHIPTGQFFTVPDLMLAVRDAGRKVGAYPVTDFWLGVEDLGDMERVRAFLASTGGEGGQ